MNSSPQPPNSLGDDDPMPFGKYGPKGADPRRMKEVPARYLDWLSGQDWIVKWPKVMAYIQWRRPAINWELEKKEMERGGGLAGFKYNGEF